MFNRMLLPVALVLSLSSQFALAAEPAEPLIGQKTINQIADELIQELIQEGDIVSEEMVAKR
jgi:hypothetical protein